MTRILRLTAVALLAFALLGSLCEKKNSPPDAPATPTGPSSGFVDSTYTFTTSGTDADGDSVSIRFAWGDGDTSNWSGFVASGESVSAAHAWDTAGTFAVTAQARDRDDDTSEWSPEQTMAVGFTRFTVLWTLEVGGRPGPPALGHDGTVYIGNGQGALKAVGPDGVEKWQVATGGSISAPAVGSDGTVYVKAGEQLRAYAPDGTELWTHEIGHNTSRHPPPALAADGTIYIGTTNGSLHALYRDGSLKWRRDSLPTFHAMAIGVDGTIYICCHESVHAVNPDGSTKWSFCPNLDILGAPSLGPNGEVYVGVEHPDNCGSVVHALSANGEVLWTYWVVSDNLEDSPMVGPDGGVYCGTWGCDDGVWGTLTALNPDGSLRWCVRTDDICVSPMLGSDSTVYAVSDSGYLYAFGIDSVLRWRMPVASWTESPALGQDVVYIADGDGLLYAIFVEGTLADSPWPVAMHDAQHTGRARAGE